MILLINRIWCRARHPALWFLLVDILLCSPEFIYIVMLNMLLNMLNISFDSVYPIVCFVCLKGLNNLCEAWPVVYKRCNFTYVKSHGSVSGFIDYNGYIYIYIYIYIYVNTRLAPIARHLNKYISVYRTDILLFTWLLSTQLYHCILHLYFHTSYEAPDVSLAELRCIPEV